MTELTRAGRVFAMTPEHPVISDAAIITDSGVVCEIGPYEELAPGFSGPMHDLGNATLAPGLINAHCHLELSHLRGLTVPGQGFMTWVEDLLRQPIFDLPDDALARAVDEMKRTGTVMVADIATRFPEKMAGFLEKSGFFFVVFLEAIGEDLPENDLIPPTSYEYGRASVAGHSLYTTHTDLLRAAKAEANSRNRPFSLHLAEHDEEVAIMAGDESQFLKLLQARGRLLDFEPPKKSPVQQAGDLELLDSSTLCIHCVKLSQQDVDTIAESGASVCLCPRSNEFIGVGRSPWEDLRAAGIPCCLGTDSIASNHDLNLWNEAEYLKKNYAGPLSIEEALAMMTVNPARALGVDDKLGTLEAGKTATWATVPDSFLKLFEEGRTGETI